MHPGTLRTHAAMTRLLGLTPMPHQADCSARMLQAFGEHGSFAVLHGLGSGKTITTLGSFLQLCEDGYAGSLLVVCPSSVVSAWQRDARKIDPDGSLVDILPLTHNGSARRAAALQRRLLERAQFRDKRPLIVAVNYESSHRLQADLEAAKFDMIVCDESQRIKDPGTSQSKAMHSLGAGAQFCAILSGTPIPEGVAGWFSQFKFLDPSVFGTRKNAFEQRWMIKTMVGPAGRQWPVVKPNPHMLPEMERLIMSRAHQVATEDVIELQGQSFIPVEVELGARARKLYDEMAKESMAIIDEDAVTISTADMALTRLTRLQQITSGFLKDEDGVEHDIDTAKLDALRDLLETLKDEGKKAVVFYRWRRDGARILEVAQKIHGKKASIGAIHGGVPMDARDDIIREFQEGDSPVFVAQIKAAGLGIDLWAAHHDIYYSVGHSCEQFEQSLARTYRHGQTSAVTHHLIQAVETIDAGVFDDLMNKRDAQERFVVDGWQRHMASK